MNFLNNQTDKILRESIARAEEIQAPIILASTTGVSAKKALGLTSGRSAHLVIVRHDERCLLKSEGFRREILAELKKHGHAVLSYEKAMPIPLWSRRLWSWFFKAGSLLGGARCTAIKVCQKIVQLAYEAGEVRVGQKVIAIAGEERGLNTAVIFQIQEGKRQSLILEKIVTAKTPIVAMSIPRREFLTDWKEVSIDTATKSECA